MCGEHTWANVARWDNPKLMTKTAGRVAVNLYQPSEAEEVNKNTFD